LSIFVISLTNIRTKSSMTMINTYYVDNYFV
jgi:hypothetical protein